MDREEALKLLTGGEDGLNAWNRRRGAGEVTPDLRGADLRGADLRGASTNGADLRGAVLRGTNLNGADLSGAVLEGADLRGADLGGAVSGALIRGMNPTWDDLDHALSVAVPRGPIVRGADLRGAVLTRANLGGAELARADLRGAILTRADLGGVDLTWANLIRADLRGADLRGAVLSGAILRGADLGGADLRGAILRGTDLGEADLSGAQIGATVFGDLDLTEVRGLEAATHFAPSTVGIDALARSRGAIPDAFLRGCGLTPWEMLAAKLYDPALTPPQAADLQYRIFDAWTKGRSLITGCFLSHSWSDKTFVDTLRDRLINEGINVWLDRHDMVAGPLQVQLWRAIQVHHVVLLVLSKNSIESDWVENELEMARDKEKAEGRTILCPVALDDAWMVKVTAKNTPGDPFLGLWRKLKAMLVMDFSGWKQAGAFEEAFGKLVRGLKTYYGPGVVAGDAAEEDPAPRGGPVP